MYQIKSDFPGGNIQVLESGEDTALVEVELRDTEGDWFYWCFSVEGAEGKTLTFRFPSPTRVGYYGAAVSRDHVNYCWQYPDTGHEGDSFTYTFGEEEHKVYFAHDIVYLPTHFEAFCERLGCEARTLCKSEQGRDVPFDYEEGVGDQVILLTARHHACEATGSWVLEGALEELIYDPYFITYHILAVPFMDYDGVVGGDQGKNRRPHDHNRDYDPAEPALYATVDAVRRLAEENKVVFAFDFHSPWHCGGRNDTVFFPMKSEEQAGELMRLSRLLEEECGEGALPHFAKDDLLPNVEWNRAGTPTCATFMIGQGATLATSLETPYFTASGVPFTPDAARETGRAFVRALRRFLEGEGTQED